jgi:hypothetical protein
MDAGWIPGFERRVPRQCPVWSLPGWKIRSFGHGQACPIFLSRGAYLSRELALIRTVFIGLCIAILLSLPASAAAETSTSKGPGGTTASGRHLSSTRSVHKARRATTSSNSKNRNTARGKRTREPRGQRVISSERTREIQDALIREHYLEGEPSGVWDQRTRDALIRYQAENGWQSKITPDSRALIKLGLGPSHDGLLNPDSAALSTPYGLGVEKPVPGGR